MAKVRYEDKLNNPDWIPVYRPDGDVSFIKAGENTGEWLAGSDPGSGNWMTDWQLLPTGSNPEVTYDYESGRYFYLPQEEVPEEETTDEGDPFEPPTDGGTPPVDWVPPPGGGDAGQDPFTPPIDVPPGPPPTTPPPVLPGQGGSGALPGTGAPGIPGYQGGYNWNWEAFRPGASDVPQSESGNPMDYYTPNYVPGQESPWGQFDIPGGNETFYRNQFNNLLMGEQGFQQAQLAAAMRRREAERQQQQNPYQFQADWDAWTGGTLPDVQMGTGGPSNVQTGNFNLNPGYSWTGDTSNEQILADLAPILSAQDRQFLDKHPDYLQQGNWAGDRQNVIDWVNANPYTKDKGWNAAIDKLARNIWMPELSATGPSAPPGYAAPVGG